jgi:hypothetical protein
LFIVIYAVFEPLDCHVADFSGSFLLFSKDRQILSEDILILIFRNGFQGSIMKIAKNGQAKTQSEALKHPGIAKRRGFDEAYKARPPYQRNDYIGWIMRAKLKATHEKKTKSHCG